MEAAVKAATEAFSKVGQEAGDAAMKEAILAYYLSKDKSEDGLKMPQRSWFRQKIEEKPQPRVFASVKDNSQAQNGLKKLASATVAKDSLSGLMTTAKEVQEAFGSAGDKAGEAYALNIMAHAHAFDGAGEEAARAARAAYDLISSVGNKEAEVPVLMGAIAANLVRRDLDEAMTAANKIVRIHVQADDKKAGAYAMDTVANIYLASAEPGQAVKAAEEALALGKAAGDLPSQVIALSTLSKVHGVMGKPVSAQKAAKEILGIVKAKKDTAAGLVYVADAHPASKESLDAGKRSAALFQELGDKVGEGYATTLTALALLAQPQRQLEEGLATAKSAVDLFKGAGDKAGEAFALTAVAMAQIRKEAVQDAEDAAQSAIAAFNTAKDSFGESYANSLLHSARFAGLQPSVCKLMFDDFSCAHIDVNELATQESLEALVGMLHNWTTGARGKGMKCLVMHVEGVAGPPSMQSYAITSGAFLLGIRSVGLPVCTAVWGKIAGPSWGLVLASDYRIAQTDTIFMLPIWGPPECLADLVGQSVAAQLCMNYGPITALDLLEANVLHQVHENRLHAEKAASEFGKRIATYPGIACRQTMCLMNPAVERFALTAARGYAA